MRTGFEDQSRPRAVTLAASLALLQTTFWIVGLVWMVLGVQLATIQKVNEPLEGWILPLRHLVWHQLKWRFAEGLAVAVLASLVLKRRGWARRLLELAVLVRGLVAISPFVALFSLGPLLWQRYELAQVQFTLVPFLILTLPMPLILWLLEKMESRRWFGGGEEPAFGPRASAIPRLGWLGPGKLAGAIAMLVVVVTSGLYVRRAPLGNALEVRSARLERRKSTDRSLDEFVIELENKSRSAVVLVRFDFDLLTYEATSPSDHSAATSTGVVIEPGESRAVSPGTGWDLSRSEGERLLVLTVYYGRRWDFETTTHRLVLKLVSSGADSQPTRLQPVSEGEGNEILYYWRFRHGSPPKISASNAPG